MSLAVVYAAFAVTLLMRPIGSALFGHYADVHGRKGAILIAIIGVGVSTAAFGTLPTIAQAGFIAPVIFLRHFHVNRDWRAGAVWARMVE
jgi:MFS family permease